MAVPHTSTNFSELKDIRFQRIANEEYNKHPDMIPKLFSDMPHNGRDRMTFNAVSTIGDFEQSSTVQYKDQHMMYDTELVYLEFTNGLQIERKLFDDDQQHIWTTKPKSLGRAAYRTRQQHGARIFNNAFSVDGLFYTQEEGVALCSNSHTTTTGASTASGFDNLILGSLTATSVATARIQMTQFRGTQGEVISLMPDTLLFSPDNYEQAFEIVNSAGKLDTANNNANVHEGRYKLIEWNFLTDTNNWFMMDSAMMSDMLHWSDRVMLEYGFVEDFETFSAKYRAYMRYAMAWTDWRFVLGALVS